MQQQQGATGLNRVLGLFDATCLVIGAVVGTGIFFTPQRVAQIAGSGDMALLTWAIGGLIALFGALCFAELGGLYVNSGGQYEILRDAYGPLPAFVFVFCNATAIQAGATAIIAIVCMKNLGIAFGGGVPSASIIPIGATALIVGLMMANILGVRWGSTIQNVTTLAKVITLLAVTTLAIAYAHTSHTPASAQSGTTNHSLGWAGALFAALVPAAFSYGGWQHVLWIAGEVRAPKKNVPRAIIIGIIVVVTVYLLANWSYLSLLGYEQVAGSSAIAADAVAAVWPNAGRRAVAGAVALSAFGVLNTQLLSGPRLVFGMAADGRFFRSFARVHTRFATPYAAILLIGCIALSLLWAAGAKAVDMLLTGVVAIDGTFFALTGLAVVLLRRKRADAPRPVRVPGYPATPIIFAACEALIVVGAFLDPDARRAAIIGAIWIVAAMVLYLLCFRRRL